jgi:hypothetical protein
VTDESLIKVDLLFINQLLESRDLTNLLDNDGSIIRVTITSETYRLETTD